MSGTLRYLLPDEPRPSLLARLAIPPLFLLPLTIYIGLIWSPLLLALPGLNSLVLGGHSKWRGFWLALLAPVLFTVLTVCVWLLQDYAGLSGLPLNYAKDAVLAITLWPLLYVLADQQRIIALRQFLES